MKNSSRQRRLQAINYKISASRLTPETKHIFTLFLENFSNLQSDRDSTISALEQKIKENQDLSELKISQLEEKISSLETKIETMTQTQFTYDDRYQYERQDTMTINSDNNSPTSIPDGFHEVKM